MTLGTEKQPRFEITVTPKTSENKFVLTAGGDKTIQHIVAKALNEKEWVELQSSDGKNSIVFRVDDRGARIVDRITTEFYSVTMLSDIADAGTHLQNDWIASLMKKEFKYELKE